ncbi:chorismate mutase [bacterium]|nr:chorismate mutase [bacterium]
MEDRIKKLRQELDVIDDNIAKLIASRIEIGREIVRLKKEAGLPKDDKNRENEILERISKPDSQVDGLLKELYKRIFDWVKNQ